MATWRLYVGHVMSIENVDFFLDVAKTGRLVEAGHRGKATTPRPIQTVKSLEGLRQSHWFLHCIPRG